DFHVTGVQTCALPISVELKDVLDAEAALELGPDVGTQAVAEGQPQLVALLVRVFRAVDQIAAQLADIDEQGRARRLDVGPEMGEIGRASCSGREQDTA